MPSTVYKGDLVEASFGHESGITLKHDYAGTFRFVVAADAGWPSDTSTIYFTGGAANTPVNGGTLAYPEGMLVGSQLIFKGLSGAWNSGTLSHDDNNSRTGRVYSIVEHTYDHANTRTQLKISPALRTDHSSTLIASSTSGSALEILPYKTPTFDLNSVSAQNANAAAERVLTDQFVGIVNTIVLPETKVDLKRFHVVGLGRDVAIQTPGRFLNQGGSFEANLHNSRWLYYCLGHEVVKTDDPQTGGQTFVSNGAIAPGDSIFYFDGSSTAPTLTPGGAIAAGDYVVLVDAATTELSTHIGDIAGGTWPTNGANSILNKAIKQEARRIAAIHKSGSDYTVWLDDPFDFSHADNTSVKFLRYQLDTATGSPDLDLTTKVIENPTKRLFFSRTTVPSFALEVSIRRHDTELGEGAATTEVVDGGASDSKQLTRVFRGCKVKDFTITADTDAALRLTTNFDAALCYTDTGREENGANDGDRYDTHRLFEDVSDLAYRKKIGIAKGTQKPFMFYNGTIKVAGNTIGQVVSFTLNGKTGVEQHYTINGVTVGDSASDQVPFAGTRNASIAVEGKTEYDLELEIIVDDPVFYHKMRRSLEMFDEDDDDLTDADMIRLSFTKQGSAGARESLDIIMDDYYITEAPLPIPEDKGPIKSTLKIMPKSVKVVAQELLLHA